MVTFFMSKILEEFQSHGQLLMLHGTNWKCNPRLMFAGAGLLALRLLIPHNAPESTDQEDHASVGGRYSLQKFFVSPPDHQT